MCRVNANCEAYYLESSQCFEAAASGLIGATKDSPNARKVFVDSSILAAHRGNWLVVNIRDLILHLTNF